MYTYYTILCIHTHIIHMYRLQEAEACLRISSQRLTQYIHISYIYIHIYIYVYIYTCILYICIGCKKPRPA